MVNYGLNLGSLLGLMYWIIGLIYPIITIILIIKRSRQMSALFVILYVVQIVLLPILMFLYGFILLFQGWRLDPILQFEQFLLTVVIICMIIKDISSDLIEN
ncbi:Ycf66 family protein [Coleofasciculus sp. H7-2]|uniref:Ycf66 family protein n=1 Tax=Coleofasciculus sp. H7-2 TaxID=3351545 RepID=UPI0036727631